MITADLSNAFTFNKTLQSFHKEFTSTKHLNEVSKAAFAIMKDEFNKDTAGYAFSAPELFHHVYEWELIGNPKFALFDLKAMGQGGSRQISWDWKASKKTVPTMVDALGKPKYPPGFPANKLKRVHVFVWKAPIMEYGIKVTIRPQLSKNKLLVLPNPNRRLGIDTDPRAPRPVVFTPHAYTTTVGGAARFQFSSWFERWFSVFAPKILDESLTKDRDNAFYRAFRRRTIKLADVNPVPRTVSFTANAKAAQEGEKIAKLIAGDLERNYIEAARNRRVE